jgi:oligopeptide/dipeptide ABC transporter ATP-binding protein
MLSTRDSSLRLELNMEPVLNVRGLKTYFYTSRGSIRAVDGTDFYIEEGETLGLLGESGCGKTVTALSILRLVREPGKIIGGEIIFEGQNILALSQEQVRKIRGNKISMIFQEPMSSLNPVYTIGDQIAEILELHQKLNKRDAYKRTVELLKLVGIPSPEMRVKSYPHQLSGGMRQRAMIAMALACRPRILIADEPTTALDVTIQAQILDLMVSLKEEIHTGILFITHNLAILNEIATRILVMYAGKLMEEGTTQDCLRNPLHPYTQGLLRSVPQIESDSSFSDRRLPTIPGMIPDLRDLPRGCTFHPRCPHTMRVCGEEIPPLKQVDDSRQVRCWLFN